MAAIGMVVFDVVVSCEDLSIGLGAVRATMAALFTILLSFGIFIEFVTITGPFFIWPVFYSMEFGNTVYACL